MLTVSIKYMLISMDSKHRLYCFVICADSEINRIHCLCNGFQWFCNVFEKAEASSGEALKPMFGPCLEISKNKKRLRNLIIFLKVPRTQTTFLARLARNGGPQVGAEL